MFVNFVHATAHDFVIVDKQIFQETPTMSKNKNKSFCFYYLIIGLDCYWQRFGGKTSNKLSMAHCQTDLYD